MERTTCEWNGRECQWIILKKLKRNKIIGVLMKCARCCIKRELFEDSKAFDFLNPS